MAALNRQSLISGAKGAAVLGGLAVAGTGAADGIGLTNTASLALVGTMLGPWGTVAGAGVGALIDLKEQGDGAADGIESLRNQIELLPDAVSSADIQVLRDRLALLRKDVEDYTVGEIGSDVVKGIGDVLNPFDHTLTGNIQGQGTRLAELEKLERQLDSAGRSSGNFALLLNRDMGLTQEQFNLSTASAEDFSNALLGIESQLGDTSSMIAYERALDALQASFKTDKSFDPDEAAGLDNLGNAVRLTDTAISRMQALLAAGKEVAAVKVFNEAITDLEKFAGSSKEAERQLRPLIDALLEVSGITVTPEVDLNTKPALSALEAWEQEFFGRDGDTITTFIKTIDLGAQLGAPAGRGGQDGDPKTDWATGGYTGPGGKYEPAGVVHKGELVLPQEVVNADWSLLKSRYGYLPGFADGGYVSRSVPASSHSTAGFDYDRLASSLAAVRPVMGDVSIQPHDYGEFVREITAAKKASSSDGVRAR